MLQAPNRLTFLEKVSHAHYLKCLLTSQVKSRLIHEGAKLIQSRMVVPITQTELKWQFSVRKTAGNKKGHGVVIDGLTTSTPRLSCSCRKGYEHHGPCEHIAGALLFLIHKELTRNPTSQGQGVLHTSRLPYFFELPERISEVIDFHSPDQQHFHHHQHDKLVEVEPFIGFPARAVVWTEYGRGMFNKQSVVFDQEAGWVFTTCSCNEKALRLCEHQARALGQMMRQNDRFFSEKVEATTEPKELDEQSPESHAIPFEDAEIKKALYLSELDGFIMFKPLVQYADKDADPLQPQDTLWIDEATGTYVERHSELEQRFVEWLLSLHPEFEKQKHGSLFFLSPQVMIAGEWFFRFMDELTTHQVEVYGQKELKSFKYVFSKPKTSFSIRSGMDWFDGRIGLEFNGEAVPLEKIKKALLNKQDYVVLSDGTLGLLPQEWIRKMEKYLRIGQVREGQLRIPKQHFSLLDEMLDDVDDQQLQQEIADKKKALLEFTEIEQTHTPDNLNATLRPYQMEGVNWINFLGRYGFGGILADDMGLGKTLQTITLFAQLLEQGHRGTHLVVGPTSLLHNWQKEIEKFCPALKHYVHHGSGRLTSTKDFDRFNVIITTYGTLVNDLEWIKDHTFSWLVLDESQAIKNLQSQRNKALRLISAQHKLALSGTPVENNTFELYAQMQVINPAFLGTAEHFKRVYAKPIDNDGDAEKAEELRQLIRPFILRRTKKQVAHDLPEKTETVLYCDMGPEQRSIYEKYKQDVRDALMGQIEDEGLEKSQFQVLGSLLKLRQLCLSTAIAKLDESFEENYSIKIDVLREQLHHLPSGSKALVFSQFVKMLGQVENMLHEEKISYAYLDGQTRDRQGAVDRFQNDPDCQVFIISLKAGGTGLNLTAADYVYIMDPWWNPAVEAQAIDRCYRIGQKKQVFAYKMICDNSIEEKILKLQQKKLAVAEGVVQTDESVFKQLSSEDIADLLA